MLEVQAVLLVRKCFFSPPKNPWGFDLVDSANVDAGASASASRRSSFRGGLRRNEEWEAIVGTDLAAGEMMILQACAGVTCS